MRPLVLIADMLSAVMNVTTDVKKMSSTPCTETNAQWTQWMVNILTGFEHIKLKIFSMCYWPLLNRYTLLYNIKIVFDFYFKGKWASVLPIPAWATTQERRKKSMTPHMLRRSRTSTPLIQPNLTTPSDVAASWEVPFIRTTVAFWNKHSSVQYPHNNPSLIVQTLDGDIFYFNF